MIDLLCHIDVVSSAFHAISYVKHPLQQTVQENHVYQNYNLLDGVDRTNFLEADLANFNDNYNDNFISDTLKSLNVNFHIVLSKQNYSRSEFNRYR